MPYPAVRVGRRGARAEGGINKIRPWGGPFPSGHGIKCKKSWRRASCAHNFYVKINPREKSGDAVACASVAPVRLHRLIRHKGINTRRIRAHGGGSDYIIGILAGLSQLSQDTSI